MSFPRLQSLEMPILQELVATGGAEDVRFLYSRLFNYFPQISEEESVLIQRNELIPWRKIVQRAGRELSEQGFLERKQGFWTITEKGKRKVEAESLQFEISRNQQEELSHGEIQKMLVNIAGNLNFYAETEFEFYDVVWRESSKSTRLSHVFEVQSKGNIDSAFAKLKRAFSAQRSKIFLVLTSERDLNRAKKSLEREFHDLETALTILTFSQIKLVYQNLQNVSEILREFLLK